MLHLAFKKQSEKQENEHQNQLSALFFLSKWLSNSDLQVIVIYLFFNNKVFHLNTTYQLALATI